MLCKRILISQWVTMNRINEITSGILIFLSCSLLSGNISPVSASTGLIDEPSSEEAAGDRDDSNDAAGFFESPTDIILNAEGDQAVINNTNTGTRKSIVTRCAIHGDELSDCQPDAESWTPSAVGDGFCGLAFDPASGFVFATGNDSNTPFATVWRCKLGVTRVLADCRSAFDDYSPSADFVPHFNGPNGISIHPAGNFAYVTNRRSYGEESEFRVSKCHTNTTTGRFYDCTDLALPGPDPSGITLNSSGTLAFITNTSSPGIPLANTITRCQVNMQTGALTECKNAGATGLNTPLRITLNKQSTRAFVVSTGDNRVVRCIVNASGHFSDCKSTGSGFHAPADIVLNHDDTVSFITNMQSNTVSRCLVDADGNFSACRNALYHVSIVNAADASLPFLNLSDLGHMPAITIKNTGLDLNDFHLDAVSSQHASLGELCSGGVFKGGDQCQLRLKQDASYAENNTGFTIRLFNGEELLYSLPVGVSTLSVKANNRPATSLHAFSGEVGVLKFTTSSAIDRMSFNFGNMENIFQGECLGISSLKAGDSCTLTYFLAGIDKSVRGLITVNQGGEGIYHLPVTISDTAILKVTNTVLPRYNTTAITLHNLSDRPLTSLQFLAFNSDLKLVRDSCHGHIDAGMSCSLSYFAGVDQTVVSDYLRVTAAEIVPVNIPLFISKVPEATVVVHNRGGYVMRVYYPILNADGSISLKKTGSFSNPQDRTIKAATFNDPDNLSNSIVSVKNIKLNIIAGYKRYLPACDGGQIKCTQATAGPRCYYLNRTIRADGHGCLEAKQVAGRS